MSVCVCVCVQDMSLFSLLDINECEDINTNICSDICVNEQPFFSCQCPTGKTLASDNKTCGGKLVYFYSKDDISGCYSYYHSVHSV